MQLSKKLFNNDNVRDVSVRSITSELIVIGRFSGSYDGRRVVEELVIRDPNCSPAGIHPNDVIGKGAIGHVHLTAGVARTAPLPPTPAPKYESRTVRNAFE